MIDLRGAFDRIKELRRKPLFLRRFGRLRRAGLSSVGMAIGKAAQISVTVVTLPLTLHYLGEERFGILMAIIGATQWFLLDLGIGDAVKIRLITAFARRRLEEARAFVSAGLAGMALIAASMAIAFFGSFPFVDWAGIFHAATADAASEAERSLLAAMAMILLMVPLRIVRDVYTADQRGYVYSLWLAGATVLVLPAVLVVIGLDLGMPALALALNGGIAAGLLGCTLYLFVHDRPELRPSLQALRGFEWSTLVPDSALLLILGVSLMAINGTDVVLVNYYLGGEEAALFSFAARIFIYAHTLVSFVTYPAWPALGDALASQEHEWFSRWVKILTLTVLPFSVLLVVLLVTFGRQLVLVWSGGILAPDHLFLALLGLYTLLRILADLAGFVLRAMERIRIQAWATLGEAILHIVLGILLMQRIGITGMALGPLLALALTRGWLLPLECWLAVRKTRKIAT